MHFCCMQTFLLLLESSLNQLVSVTFGLHGTDGVCMIVSSLAVIFKMACTDVLLT